MPILPAEHVHETEERGAHHHLIHSHSQPHAAARANGHPGVLDDDDALVVTLAAAYTVPIALAHVMVAPASIIRLVPPSPVELLHGPVGFVERLIHGPPRGPTASRAPPSFLAR